ncbi:unnamed protein product [Linum trigynum]|uniref:Uncharacterized protein n=1 Tax=Linum trigynum TaxID=586398 RepID=A0AAV2CYV8_9ROSI
MDPMYGDWMMVRKKECRHVRKSYDLGNRGAFNAHANVGGRNRYQVLNEDMKHEREIVAEHESHVTMVKDNVQEQKNHKPVNQGKKVVGERNGLE